jgi:hypothetical protein
MGMFWTGVAPPGTTGRISERAALLVERANDRSGASKFALGEHGGPQPALATRAVNASSVTLSNPGISKKARRFVVLRDMTLTMAPSDAAGPRHSMRSSVVLAWGLEGLIPQPMTAEKYKGRAMMGAAQAVNVRNFESMAHGSRLREPSWLRRVSKEIAAWPPL